MSSGVIDRLLAEPHRFGFFQAVRLLERWFVQQENLRAADVLGGRLKFRNSLSLSFAASEIARFTVVLKAADPQASSAETGDVSAHGNPPQSRQVQHIELTPAFMGLLGAGGCLPAAYTEFFAQGRPDANGAAGSAFLDIFLHRAVVLFYQAWCKHRLAIQFATDRSNQFLPMVLSIAGVGQLQLRDRLRAAEGGVADATLAFYAGALQQRTTSATVVRRVIAQHFQIPARLEQFIGRWFLLPLENQCRLGAIGGAPLGGGAVVGERVWQRDLRMRLTLGPLPMATFRRFLPGGPAALALQELLTMMTGVALEYEVRLSLRGEDVKGVYLDGVQGSRLGRDGFLATRAANEDRMDAGYDIHAIA